MKNIGMSLTELHEDETIRGEEDGGTYNSYVKNSLGHGVGCGCPRRLTPVIPTTTTIITTTAPKGNEKKKKDYIY